MMASVLLTDPSPVATGLFAGNDTLLEQRDRNALSCKFVSSTGPYDTCSNNNDVDPIRKRVTVLNPFDVDLHSTLAPGKIC